MMALADLYDLVFLSLQSQDKSVQFDNQDRLGIRGQACSVYGRLDGENRSPIHHFESGGYDSAGDDTGNGITRIFHRRESREKGLHSLRQRGELQYREACDTESPFRAYEYSHQIVARTIGGPAPKDHDLSARQDDLEAYDVIRSHSILEAVRPSRIFCQVSANAAYHLARGVRREVISSRGCSLGEIKVDDSRFGYYLAVFRIYEMNLLHL